MKNMAAVMLKREGRLIMAERGKNLLEVLRQAGVWVDAVCGGRGQCGRCLVKIDGKLLRACRVEVSGDLVVETLPCPEDGTAPDPEPGRTDCLRPLPYDPEIRVSYADGLWVTACSERVLLMSRRESAAFMAGVDIGTTTLSACLIEAKSGEIRAEGGCLNPQTAYGADVMSRAAYVLAHGEDGARELALCIRKAVRELLLSLLKKVGASMESLFAVSAAGNTCMHHLFFGLPVEGLVRAPHKPEVLEAGVFSAEAYGLPVHSAAPLLALPNLGGFVGGDTAACILFAGLGKRQEWTLLVDIGTNSEMVLAGKGRLLVCSAAAGPAFEGAGISCGMRAEEGAVVHVHEAGSAQAKLRGTGNDGAGQSVTDGGGARVPLSGVLSADGRWIFEVIGSGPPRGFSGSGLIDLIALMRKGGQIDRQGTLTGMAESGELRLWEAAGGGPDSSSENGASLKVLYLSGQDIAQLQLAKAAIAAGIRLIIKHAGIFPAEVGEVLLAGAFGSSVNAESARAIGLIPEEVRGRVRTLGNAALKGAAMVLMSRPAFREAAALPGQAEHLALADQPEFQEIFIEELAFPEYADGA